VAGHVPGRNHKNSYAPFATVEIFGVDIAVAPSNALPDCGGPVGSTLAGRGGECRPSGGRMTSLALGVDAPPNPSQTPLAGFWRRLAALLLDLLFIGLPTLLFGLAFYGWVVRLGDAGRLIGFVVALPYFGLLNSSLGGGQTLGKRALGIRVTDRAGNALSPGRSIVRFLMIAIPYFLNGLWFDSDFASAGVLERVAAGLVFFAVFGGLVAIAYLFVFNRRTRQSLHDLAVDSFVVRGAQMVIPASLSIPRLHRIIVGSWLSLVALVVIVALARPSVVQPFGPGRELLAVIKAQPGLHRVTMIVGVTSMVTIKTGASTTSFLQVSAQADPDQNNLEALELSIAGIVLERQPDLFGKQVLVVVVWRGVNLGLFYWTVAYHDALGAAAWRAKLGPLKSGTHNI
jgi:uncharacterized RDD family membrane protein YckC